MEYKSGAVIYEEDERGYAVLEKTERTIL